MKIFRFLFLQASGVKISDVTYRDIYGTSELPLAVKIDCSEAFPCSGIRLEDVNLTYNDQPATESCSNASGTSSGYVQPSGCLQN